MKRERRTPWLLSYNQSKKVSRKFRDLEKQISDCKENEDWDCVKRLKSFLRRVWWGIKRYKDK